MIKNTQLIAPNDYQSLSKEIKYEITNKCGPDGILNILIPNSLLGLDISESCNIHDYMFHTSRTSKNLKNADQIFLKNLKLQIRNNSSGFLKPIRTFMAYLYYTSVRIYSSLQGKPLDE